MVSTPARPKAKARAKTATKPKPKAKPARRSAEPITERIARRVKKAETKAVAKAVTKATRRPLRGTWPPAPERVRAILDGLEQLYPDVKCELDHENAFQLLVATILSAQCTDERVNQVTPKLFAMFPTPAAMAQAPQEVLEEVIRTTGFFRQKAISIRTTSAALVEKFGGEVPRDMQQLLTLRGVARKTANVVLGTVYGIADGVVVDTHVQRLALRLGLTREVDPKAIEQELMQVIPRDSWIRFSHQLIWHGRRVCSARKPDCEHCLLAPNCPSAFKES